MGEMRNVYKILVGKPEGRRPVGRPGRPKHRWEDTIKMDLREMDGRVWTGFMAQHSNQWQALVTMAMNL
jgi:hypothetical protein